MRTRRLILPFFSIPVTEAWPISPVRPTCVPPQGWRSKPSIAISRTRPVPIGGLTDIVLLSVGDPAMAHRGIECDQLVEAALDVRFVERRLARIEIEPSVRVADRPSCHRIGRHDREEV